MTLSITTPNADNMVQNHALPDDTTGFIRVYLYVIWGGKGAILLLMIKKKICWKRKEDYDTCVVF